MKTTKVILSAIPNFSRYMVSRDGNLYAIRPDGFKRLSNAVSYYGYVCNYLIDDWGRRRYMLRGVLVLLAFSSGQFFRGAESDHKNRQPTDNRLSNLRWVSHRDNCKNRRVERREKNRGLYLVYDDGTVLYYDNRQETNIPSPTLSRILSGKHSQKYKCRGFYFDRLHEQTDEVKQRVTMSLADSLSDCLYFKTADGELHKIFDL